MDQADLFVKTGKARKTNRGSEHGEQDAGETEDGYNGAKEA